MCRRDDVKRLERILRDMDEIELQRQSLLGD